MASIPDNILEYACFKSIAAAKFWFPAGAGPMAGAPVGMHVIVPQLEGESAFNLLL